MLKVTCVNGHRLRAADEHAGKKVKCPKCSAVIQLPEPEVKADVEPHDDWDMSSEEASEKGGSWDEDYDSWQQGNDPVVSAVPPLRKRVGRPAQTQPESRPSTGHTTTGRQQRVILGASNGSPCNPGTVIR